MTTRINALNPRATPPREQKQQQNQDDLPSQQISELEYTTRILEASLRRLEDRLKEEGYSSVEYELYPFDSNRVVITFGAEVLRKDRVGDLEIQIIDSRNYSISIGDIKLIDKTTLEGDIECHTWSGQLAVNASPNKFYMADVKLIFRGKFSVVLSFDSKKDIEQVSDIIAKDVEECVSKVRKSS